MQMSVTDELVHTTARIECRTSANSPSSGTGFFFKFCEQEDGKFVSALVTNKHVIDEAEVGVFHMTVKDKDDNPIYGEHIPVPIRGFEKMWVKHPDPNVDLAVLPIAPILEWLRKERGKEVFYKAIGHKLLADADFLSELSAVEEVLMIGYPNGLWDARNNLPIARRGVTATPLYVDFEGRPEFMIDCACFPGSSGSPVLLYNLGSYAKKGGGTVIGSRIKLLGVLFGGPQYTAQGEIKVVPIPSAVQPIALSRIPNNLGYCVKAEQLLAFEEHFGRLLAAQKEADTKPAA